MSIISSDFKRSKLRADNTLNMASTTEPLDTGPFGESRCIEIEYWAKGYNGRQIAVTI